MTNNRYDDLIGRALKFHKKLAANNNKGNSQAPCPIGLRGFVPSEPCDDLRW